MRRAFTWLPWVLLILVVFSFLAWQKSHQPKPTVASDGVKMPAEKVEPLVDTTRTGGVVSYNAAVKVAAPAVVNIFTTQKVKQMNHPLLNDPVFREFFGNQMPQQQQNENSLGSGVIVRADGYILTNNHVIAQAEHIVVALQDGRRAEAKVIGTDPDTDLAVIKIELDNLPVLPFKLSGNEVGDVVLAIGNPFGVGQTVTQGIISATGRSDLGINTYEDFIQTDAAINPGNSGGPLGNSVGEVIGINTFIYTGSSGSQGSIGIGFAIPINRARRIAEELKSKGRIEREYYTGLTVQPLDRKTSRYLGIPFNEGVIITQILKNSPATKANLELRDVIVAVEKEDVRSSDEIMQIIKIKDLRPGDKVKIRVWRNGRYLNKSLTLGKL